MKRKTLVLNQSQQITVESALELQRLRYAKWQRSAKKRADERGGAVSGTADDPAYWQQLVEECDTLLAKLKKL